MKRVMQRSGATRKVVRSIYGCWRCNAARNEEENRRRNILRELGSCIRFKSDE